MLTLNDLLSSIGPECTIFYVNVTELLKKQFGTSLQSALWEIYIDSIYDSEDLSEILVRINGIYKDMLDIYEASEVFRFESGEIILTLENGSKVKFVSEKGGCISFS